ncbi:hypothetical protein ACFPTR_05385 [Aliibacillus thermotolerans]|uniref:DUF3939 domain-containing protein n=1 Tax=Aliibacillus thermotolerans TaxID=1834418 RepID=A0ABW0U7X7_9BACI|nr:hypothetical protein [Aliibacillus thermotolerans]
MTRFLRLCMIGFSVLFLFSGCMYPQEKRVENQIPYEDQIESVQRAVDQFREDTGVLPIQTKDEDTPIYQKYVIDFRKLLPRYLSEPPGNSFESGGPYQYVLIDPEERAEVKLIDLRVLREIQELERAVRQYISKHEYLPIGEAIGIGIYRLDEERLDYHRDLSVESPYHESNYLPLMIDQYGNVLIDYAIDIHMMLERYDHSFQPGDDVRQILTDHSPIVPAFSVPYTIDENEDPIFMVE